MQNRTQSEPKAGRKLGRAGMSLGVYGANRVSGDRVKLQLLYPIQKSRAKEGQPAKSESCAYTLPKGRPFELALWNLPPDFKGSLDMMLLNSKFLHIGRG